MHDIHDAFPKKIRNYLVTTKIKIIITIKDTNYHKNDKRYKLLFKYILPTKSN